MSDTNTLHAYIVTSVASRKVVEKLFELTTKMSLESDNNIDGT